MANDWFSLRVFCSRLLFIPIMLWFGGGSSVVAQSTLTKTQNDRLERLERDIRTLNMRLSRGQDTNQSLPSSIPDKNRAPNPAGIARLGVRIDRLEEDIRVATGSLEDINHRISKLSYRLDKLVTDMDFRLSSLEAQVRMWGRETSSEDNNTNQQLGKVFSGKKVNGDTLGSVSVSEIQAIKARKLSMVGAERRSSVPKKNDFQVTQNKEEKPKGTPKEQYQKAFNLLQQAEYELAELKLSEFIKNNQKSPLIENARYWLGETYYVRKVYENAAQVFFDGYQASPKGAKAADSLLKLGMSLSRLGKKQDACAAFSKLSMDFKKLPKRIDKVLLRESGNNNCN